MPRVPVRDFSGPSASPQIGGELNVRVTPEALGSGIARGVGVAARVADRQAREWGQPEFRAVVDRKYSDTVKRLTPMFPDPTSLPNDEDEAKAALTTSLSKVRSEVDLVLSGASGPVSRELRTRLENYVIQRTERSGNEISRHVKGLRIGVAENNVGTAVDLYVGADSADAQHSALQELRATGRRLAEVSGGNTAEITKSVLINAVGARVSALERKGAAGEASALIDSMEDDIGATAASVLRTRLKPAIATAQIWALRDAITAEYATGEERLAAAKKLEDTALRDGVATLLRRDIADAQALDAAAVRKSDEVALNVINGIAGIQSATNDMPTADDKRKLDTAVASIQDPQRRKVALAQTASILRGEMFVTPPEVTGELATLILGKEREFTALDLSQYALSVTDARMYEALQYKFRAGRGAEQRDINTRVALMFAQSASGFSITFDKAGTPLRIRSGRKAGTRALSNDEMIAFGRFSSVLNRRIQDHLTKVGMSWAQWRADGLAKGTFMTELKAMADNAQTTVTENGWIFDSPINVYDVKTSRDAGSGVPYTDIAMPSTAMTAWIREYGQYASKTIEGDGTIRLSTTGRGDLDNNMVKLLFVHLSRKYGVGRNLTKPTAKMEALLQTARNKWARRPKEAQDRDPAATLRQYDAYIRRTRR